MAILLTERLGDILASEPVAREARRRWPNALIVWFCNGRFEPVVRCFPAVDEVFPVVCLTEIILLERSLSNWTIIDLHLHGKECSDCHIPKWRQQGNPEVTVENYYHHGSLLEAFTKAAEFPVEDKTPQLRLPENIGAKIDILGLPSSYIVVHCESDEPARNWNPIGWRLLRDEIIRAHNIDIVEIGVKSSGHLGFHERVHDACGKFTILESAELIRRARLFIGIDSGPAHLANSMQTPGLVLTGRYRSFSHYQIFSGYYGVDHNSDVSLIKHWQESPFIPVRKVFDSLHQLLGKAQRPLAEITKYGCRKEFDLALSPPSQDRAAGSSMTFRIFDSSECTLVPPHQPVAVIWDENIERNPSLLTKLISSGQPIVYSFDCKTPPSEAAIRSLVEAIHCGCYLKAWGRPIIALTGDTTFSPEHAIIRFWLFALRAHVFERPAWINLTAPTVMNSAIASKCWSTNDFDSLADGIGITSHANKIVLTQHVTKAGAPLIRSRHLKASLDSVQSINKDVIKLSGWSAISDPWPVPAAAIALLATDDVGTETIIFSTPTTHDARPDVAAHFADAGLLFCGWHCEIPSKYFSLHPTSRLIAVNESKNKYLILHDNLTKYHDANPMHQ